MIERPSAKIGENFTIDIFSKNIKKNQHSEISDGEKSSNLFEEGIMSAWKLDRREFLKVLTAAVATMGFPASFIDKVEAAVATKKKPTVIWLNFMECTGCTETLLRASPSTVGKVFARDRKP